MKDGGIGVVTTRNARDHGTGTAFHLVSGLEFAPLLTAIACARLHAVAVLHEWGLRDLAEDAAIITSELMTNAQKASAALLDRPPIALRLLCDGQRLVIEAWDYSSADVQTIAAGSDAESGRGLVIVEALSHRWGESCRGVNCKVIWAELALP